jgi:hypothetical protein
MTSVVVRGDLRYPRTVTRWVWISAVGGAVGWAALLELFNRYSNGNQAGFAVAAIFSLGVVPLGAFLFALLFQLAPRSVSKKIFGVMAIAGGGVTALLAFGTLASGELTRHRRQAPIDEAEAVWRNAEAELAPWSLAQLAAREPTGGPGDLAWTHLLEQRLGSVIQSCGDVPHDAMRKLARYGELTLGGPIKLALEACPKLRAPLRDEIVSGCAERLRAGDPYAAEALKDADPSGALAREVREKAGFAADAAP